MLKMENSTRLMYVLLFFYCDIGKERIVIYKSLQDEETVAMDYDVATTLLVLLQLYRKSHDL